MFLLLSAVILLLWFVGLPTFLSSIGYNWLKRKGYKRSAYILPTIIIGLFLFTVYRTFYPMDSFYIKEFEKNTAMVLPKSAKVLEKEANAPYLWNDYKAQAIISVSEQDYKTILSEVRSDNDYTLSTDPYHFIGLEVVLEMLESKEGSRDRIALLFMGGRTSQFYIGFLKDGKTIVFESIN
jgi:hypothetical protein